VCVVGVGKGGVHVRVLQTRGWISCKWGGGRLHVSSFAQKMARGRIEVGSHVDCALVQWVAMHAAATCPRAG